MCSDPEFFDVLDTVLARPRAKTAIGTSTAAGPQARHFFAGLYVLLCFDNSNFIQVACHRRRNPRAPRRSVRALSLPSVSLLRCKNPRENDRATKLLHSAHAWQKLHVYMARQSSIHKFS
jgi:hypothetical protein